MYLSNIVGSRTNKAFSCIFMEVKEIQITVSDHDWSMSQFVSLYSHIIGQFVIPSNRNISFD